jgi:hypothetical protein
MPSQSVIVLIYYHQKILACSKIEYNLRLDTLKTPKPVKYSISVETSNILVENSIMIWILNMWVAAAECTPALIGNVMALSSSQ